MLVTAEGAGSSAPGRGGSGSRRSSERAIKGTAVRAPFGCSSSLSGRLRKDVQGRDPGGVPLPSAD